MSFCGNLCRFMYKEQHPATPGTQAREKPQKNLEKIAYPAGNIQWNLATIRRLAGILALIGLGIGAILNPELMDGYDPDDMGVRRTFFKEMLVKVWSVPLGLAFLVIGIFQAWRFINRR